MSALLDSRCLRKIQDVYFQRGSIRANIQNHGGGIVGGNGEKGIMKLVLIGLGILCFILGNRFMNEYDYDKFSTVGIVFMILGMVLGIVGLMMTPPM